MKALHSESICDKQEEEMCVVPVVHILHDLKTRRDQEPHYSLYWYFKMLLCDFFFSAGRTGDSCFIYCYHHQNKPIETDTTNQLINRYRARGSAIEEHFGSEAGCQFATPSLSSQCKKGGEDASLFHYNVTEINCDLEAPGFHALSVFIPLWCCFERGVGKRGLLFYCLAYCLGWK